MWRDKWLYWAWDGGAAGYCNPPTEKHILYDVVDGVYQAVLVIDA